ncbi:RHS repeat-associated core domain-containing protein [Leifsonia sp. McL0607]|uniref:RHS repeat-associated core domain-containing protein n=1 Tax=Leifsonia sp. McL0607 TaxID=3415672 RepID=UPI003CF4950C
MLKHSFPDPGDGTSAALWLNSVTHTGHAGASPITEPAVTFAGTTMQNRVWAVDGLAPLDKWRISSIKTELGAVVSVNYSGQECTPGDRAGIFAAPQSNTKRCYPQWWSPSDNPPMPPQQDLFHKYVVTSVMDNPTTGGAGAPPIQKHYSYTGPGWRYNDSPLTPADKRTWSIFAGFATAEVRVGDFNKPAEQNVTKYTFFRGLDGDRAAAAGGVKSVQVGGVVDARQFAGRVREQVVTNGVGGAVISHTASVPWSALTVSAGTHSAWYTGDGQVVVTEPVSTGGNRTVTTTTAYDSAIGLPVAVLSAPSDAPVSCVTTRYATANVAAHIFGRVAEVLATTGTCEQAASAGADRLISHVRNSYDGAAVGAVPVKGNLTKTETVTGFDGAAKRWATTATVKYDALGRAIEAADVAGRVSKTAYTPAGTGGPITKVTSTNPVGWSSSTELDPAWGAITAATDENGKVTTAAYDALGRRTGVWLPNRPKAENASSPSTAFTYTVSQSGPSSVTTESVLPLGVKKTFELVDGLGRSVQTQTAAVRSGAVIADTVYDSQGRTVSTTSPYWASTTPSDRLFVPTSMAQIPSRTDTKYDPVGRAVASILYTYGDESKRTSTAYPGADRVDVTPPTGGTPTSTITNSLGQKTALTQYTGVKPAGAGHTTTYAFTAAGKMSAMTDAAGNSWSWSYDLAGNQTVASDPDSGTTTSTYDLVGNLTSTTDARGQTLAYGYDELNRKTGKYSGSTAGAVLASWTYDAAAKGQLSKATSYVGSVPGKPGLAYVSSVDGYDELYNATSTSVSIPQGAAAFGGTTYKVSMTYNEAGLLQQRSLPAIGGLALERLRTLYDGVGNVDSISGTSLYGEATYSPIGQLSVIARGVNQSLLWTTYGFDPGTGETTQVIDTAFVGASSSEVANRKYTRNAAGDVTSIKTTGSAGADDQCFSYGVFHALSEAWTPASGDCQAAPTAGSLGGAAPYWTSYTVDAGTGNRTATTNHTATGEITTAYAYPAAGQARPHAVTTVNSAEYSYDASGNTVTRPGQGLSWDESGKLSTVSVDGGIQSRVYDADGNVLLQTDPNTGTTLYLGETEVTMAPGASKASAVRTYSLGDVPVAERSTKAGVSGSVVTWVSGDLNHTRDVAVDVVTGKITRRFADPYGNPRGTTPVWGSEHGYLNKPVSATTGLTQLGARAYDPVLGKFISVDPVLAPENPQQNNGYTYSHNNPITESDPSGLCGTGRADFLPQCINSGVPAGGVNISAPQPASSSGKGGPGPRPANGDPGYRRISPTVAVADTSASIGDRMRRAFEQTVERYGLDISLEVAPVGHGCRLGLVFQR